MCNAYVYYVQRRRRLEPLSGLALEIVKATCVLPLTVVCVAELAGETIACRSGAESELAMANCLMPPPSPRRVLFATHAPTF